MPRVLIIAHHFPPAGTGGVGRALGWARHLPALGWDVTVLAATPAPNWPLDASLLEQIPTRVRVHRIASADPRPESLRGIGRRELSFLWHRPALAFARNLLRGERFDVILATSPPPTSLRLAATLGKEFGTPWVADFRDPWAVPAPGAFRSWRRRVYASQAQAITSVNATLSAHLEEALGRKVTTIHNGFEPDEIPKDVQRVPRRAVYLGTLPKLDTLAQLFRALSQTDGEFFHIGAPNPDLPAFALSLDLKRVHSTGYLSRTDALRQAATGSVFITALESGFDLAVPTKVFDYIGLGGPILHLGNHRAVVTFISEHMLGEAVSANASAITLKLKQIWDKQALCPDKLRSRFTRKRQAEQTASVLSGVLKDQIG